MKLELEEACDPQLIMIVAFTFFAQDLPQVFNTELAVLGENQNLIAIQLSLYIYLKLKNIKSAQKFFVVDITFSILSCLS